MEESDQLKEVIASLNTKRKPLISNNGVEKRKCSRNLEIENGARSNFTTNQQINFTERKPKCRTKLDAFLFQNPSKVISHNNNSNNKQANIPNEGIDSDTKHEQSFENQDLLIPTKKPKKAPANNSRKNTKASGKSKPSSTSKRKSNKVNSSEKNKKSQLSIKSAFWLSNVTAQQSRLEDIEEQELQLALNISSIEFENSNQSCTQTTQYDDDGHLERDSGKRDKEFLKNKLQMYGFRKGRTQDYELVANNFRPKNTNNSKKSCAWLNKYTALTLRNSEQQYKKLTDNIQLAITTGLVYINNKNKQNSLIQQSCIDHENKYKLISSILKDVHCQYLNIFKHENQQDLPAYFVDKIFDIKLECKYSLLKDWSKIPGRTDLSPAKSGYENKDCESKLHSSEMVSNRTTERLLSVASLKEKYIHDINTDLDKQIDHEQIHVDGLADKEKNETTTLNVESNSSILFQTPKKTQCQVLCNESIASPDLFADTDDEINDRKLKEVIPIEIDAINCDSDNVEKPNSIHELNTVVDLTQEDSNSVSEEFVFTGKTAKSAEIICEQDNTNSSTNIVSNIELDVDDEYNNDNGIFEKLREKYLSQISQESPNLVSTNTRSYSYEHLNNNERFSTSVVDTVTEYTKQIDFGNSNNSGSKLVTLSQSSTNDDSNDNEMSDNEFLLSDDEVNYSIRKAQSIANNSRLIKELNQESGNCASFETASLTTISTKRSLEFDLDYEFVNNSSSYNHNLSSNSDLNTKSNCETSKNTSTLHLSEDVTSSCEELSLSEDDSKSLELVNDINTHDTNLANPNSTYSDDEFDRLVRKYDNKTESNLKSSQKTKNNLNVPNITSDYPEGHKDNLSSIKTNCKKNLLDIKSNFTSIDKNSKDFEEVTLNGRIYLVRPCTSPKPDFVNMSENEILLHLYKYGLKKLKRTQAIKILEYIYNQTHPLIEDSDEVQSIEDDSDLEYEHNSKELPITQETDKLSNLAKNTVVLKDSSGTEMLQYRDELQLEFLNEDYIFQTNITKKTLRPLLPLHVAWYNMICANPSLHEAVLMYEPIDLQDIYLFWKNIGYRYNPKELKTFFDKRSIIFRYDLVAPTNSNSAS